MPVRFQFILVFLCVATLGYSLSSSANTGTSNAFRTKYDRGRGISVSCNTCHSAAGTGLCSSGLCNPYGQALRTAGCNGNACGDAMFAGVENTDSDGDGFRNGEEIDYPANRGFYNPGDPLSNPNVQNPTPTPPVIPPGSGSGGGGSSELGSLGMGGGVSNSLNGGASCASVAETRSADFDLSQILINAIILCLPILFLSFLKSRELTLAPQRRRRKP